MIKVRELRFVTALAVSGIAILTMSRGLQAFSLGSLEAFSRASANVDSFKPMAATRGIASFALRDILSGPSDARDAVKDRRARTMDLLSIVPTDSVDWFRLAAIGLSVDDKPEKILSALAISSMTGPNEAPLMMARSALGLTLWNDLPVESRRTIVNDILGSWSSMSQEQRTGLRNRVALLSPGQGTGLRSLLLLNGDDKGTVASALGLDSKPVESDTH